MKIIYIYIYIYIIFIFLLLLLLIVVLLLSICLSLSYFMIIYCLIPVVSAQINGLRPPRTPKKRPQDPRNKNLESIFSLNQIVFLGSKSIDSRCLDGPQMIPGSKNKTKKTFLLKLIKIQCFVINEYFEHEFSHGTDLDLQISPRASI